LDELDKRPRRLPAKAIMKRLLGMLKGKLWLLGFAFLFTLAAIRLEMATQQVTKHTVNHITRSAGAVRPKASARAANGIEPVPADEAVEDSGHTDTPVETDSPARNETYKRLWILLALLFGTVAGRMICSFVSGVLGARMTQKAVWQLRLMLYDVLQKLGFSFYDKALSGQLISRVTSDVHRVEHFYRSTIFRGMEVAVVVPMAVFFMFAEDALLTVVSLTTLPVVVWVLARFARRVGPQFGHARERYGAMTTVLKENVSGVRVVRAFGSEPEQVDRFTEANDDYYNTILGAISMWALNMPVANVLFGLANPIAIGVGAFRIVQGGMTLGGLVAFMGYLNIVAMRGRMFARTVAMTLRSVASADRIFELVDTEPAVKTPAEPVPLPPGRGRVDFEDVSFEYEPGKAILRDVNLSVRPGEVVALVGHTGCGKTSLVHLLPRFYDVTAGRILIDGVDVRDVELTELRQNVALVFQDVFLFNATIAENIAYGRPDATEDDIRRCAQAAGAHDFVLDLEQGYDTEIGERGVTLSGGQKQRLSIARALLQGARVLVLDDWTASVDATTEAEIQKAIAGLISNRTTFVIAHRLSTVMRADRIVVLERGRIVQQGTHNELVNRDGYYRRIYRMQFAHGQAT